MSREQLHELVNRLPESEVTPAARYLEFLIAHEEPPVDPEMLARSPPTLHPPRTSNLEPFA